ncbi:nectin-1-like isoform X2 [Cetorhinus maximus]
MEDVFYLIICLFLSTNGKQIHKELPPGHRNGVGLHCELTEKAAIGQLKRQVEHNETTCFLVVILKNSSLENANCSKCINASLTNRVSNRQFTTEKPNRCVFTNSCAAKENQVKLTILISPAFSKKQQSDFKDQLVTTCRAAKGGLAPKIVRVSSKISMRGRNRTQQQNQTRTVSSSYKPTQHRNGLKNVTCMINHPTLSAPVELFVGCPFAIAIKTSNYSVKGKKNKFIFNTMDSEQIIQLNINSSVEQIDLYYSKQNDSFPEGIELVKNNLKFKGPMKESYAGMYMCVVSYQHWKKTAYLEIEITSDENQWIPTRAVLIAISVIFAASACFCYVLRC